MSQDMKSVLSKDIQIALAIFCCVTICFSFSQAHAQTRPTDQILNYKGADRTSMLIEGAKKEGEIVFYSAMIVNQALRPVADGFMKKYPFVKASYWRADTSDTMAKVSAEQRAGNVVSDVIEGTGIGENVIQAGFALSFDSPVLEEYPKERRDPRKLWAATRLSYYSLGFNTKQIAQGTQPKSYEDLLDPRWKGKLSWRIGPAGGMELFLTTLRIAWGEERAMTYLAQLRSQDIVNFGSGSARTLVDRVMAGEFPMALNIFAHHPLISAKSGAPVDSQLFYPVTTTAAILTIPTGLRHPHAAMLFVDFLLSKEGQAILAGAEYFPAHPDVPPLEIMERVVPAKAGMGEVFINPTLMPEYNTRSGEIWQDVFRK